MRSFGKTGQCGQFALHFSEEPLCRVATPRNNKNRQDLQDLQDEEEEIQSCKSCKSCLFSEEPSCRVAMPWKNEKRGARVGQTVQFAWRSRKTSLKETRQTGQFALHFPRSRSGRERRPETMKIVARHVP